jgi:hypothetical protein
MFTLEADSSKIAGKTERSLFASEQLRSQSFDEALTINPDAGNGHENTSVLDNRTYGTIAIQHYTCRR